MTPKSESCDVLIGGGGPAGAALAILLARWGRSVVLVDAGAPRGKPPEETIVPGAPVFERLGLGDLLELEDAAGTPHHGAIWGSGELAWRKMSASGPGYKVDRVDFDAALRERACRAGARVLEGWRVEAGLEGSGPALLRDSRGRTQRIEARERVAALGNLAPRAALGARRARSLPATFAIWGRARADTHLDATLIEAVRQGWLWWLPLARGEVCVTLFADRGELRDRGVEALFAGALNGALGPAGTVNVGPLRTVPATACLWRSSGTTHLVGASAASIDPLSSQGLEVALTSAEDAAYALNTLLDEPELRDDVRRMRDDWSTRLFDAHAAKALSYYANEMRFADAPFWTGRHDAGHALAPEVDVLPPRLRRAPEVRSAPGLRRGGRKLVPVEAYALGTERAPRHAVGSVDLAAVFELLEQTGDPLQLMQLAARHPRLVALSPAVVKGALLELLRTGFLVDASD